MAAPLRTCVSQLNGLLRPSPLICSGQLSRLLSASPTPGPVSSSKLLPSPSSPYCANLGDGSPTSHRGLHQSAFPLCGIFRNTEFDEHQIPGIKMNSTKWDMYNEVVYPPRDKDAPVRPAEVCHARFNIKYSPKKMWYIAVMIRGMSVEEAIKQLQFYRRKGAQSVLEVIEEAQNMAVNEHNVEYKTNLWISSSFVGKGKVVKGLRKHMGPRYGIIHYRYVHYFVRLTEGKPPKHYYPPPKTGLEKLEDYVQDWRGRNIRNSL